MLYLVSTPIGNLEDISLRALRILREADIVLAEDTRHTGLLLNHYDIPHKSMISFYEEVENQKLPGLLNLIRSGQKVVLVSDAGSPLISDPGYKLVREILRSGEKVAVIPGASALIAALQISGLPPDRFVFLGYFPDKVSHQKLLLKLVGGLLQIISLTVIFYASPYKLKNNLESMEEILGDVEIVVVRELTKIYEEVWRGKVSQARLKFAKPKGEFVVLYNKTANI